MVPELSIILLSYNRKELTSKALDNLLEMTDGIDAEIIVVDNASTDGTAQMLEQRQGKPIRLLLNNTNRYYSGGNNDGLAMCTGKYVLFTQNDFFFSMHSIKTLLQCYKHLPDCGMLGVGGGMINSEGSISELTDWFQNPLRRFHYIPVDFISGCCMLTKRNLLQENDISFNEEYILYYEDVDISHQVKKAGYKTYMLNNRIIQTDHLRSASITPLLGTEERERIRDKSRIRYLSNWIPYLGKSPLHEPDISYCCFKESDLSGLPIQDEDLRQTIPEEMVRHEKDIRAIRKAEYFEMHGARQDAIEMLQKIVTLNPENFMAWRNLYRMLRDTNDITSLEKIIDEIAALLTVEKHHLFQAKLLKHYQIALSDAAANYREQNDLHNALYTWQRLEDSAQTETTVQKCRAEKQTLSFMLDSPPAVSKTTLYEDQ